MNEPTPPTFHERQRLATQDAILDAVERRLGQAGLDELTFADVAAEAGTSERTVYRHFPTKGALLEAFWDRVQRTLRSEASTRSWADFVASRPAAFAEMDRRAPVVRALLRSTQAREAGDRPARARQDGVRRVVAEAVGGLPEPELTELCAVVHLLGSAPAWQALRDAWGFDGERAGRVVARAIETLVEAARRDAEGLPPDREVLP